MRISDWSSDVCSSDLSRRRLRARKCRLHSVSNGRSFRSRNFGRGTMAYLQQRPTAAFRVVAILLTLWNAFGCYAWYLQWTLGADAMGPARSEEHTSELQSLMRISYAVFCLKKKNQLMKPTLFIH